MSLSLPVQGPKPWPILTTPTPPCPHVAELPAEKLKLLLDLHRAHEHLGLRERLKKSGGAEALELPAGAAGAFGATVPFEAPGISHRITISLSGPN